MYLDKEEKQKIFKDHGRLKKNNDTGSAESQIALFTYRIKHLTDHLRTNKNDHSKHATPENSPPANQKQNTGSQSTVILGH